MRKKIVVLEDGTRVYSNYTKYVPVPDAERKYRRRKPDDPRARRWGGEWLLPLELTPDDQRVMPKTRPFTDAWIDHRRGVRRHPGSEHPPAC